MDVLILGGTGAIGSHLVKLCANHNVTITSRSNRKSIFNQTYVKGNAHDDLFLNKLLKRNWDIIIDFMIYNTIEFQKKHKILLKSCHQYVFLSSERVYSESKIPITENSPLLLDTCIDKNYLSTDEYALAKTRQEHILKTSKFNNWVIVRPSITYSENRLQLGTFELNFWYHSNKILFPDVLLDKYTTMTYAKDVANTILKIVEDGTKCKETFNIAIDKSIKWKNVIEVYQSVLKQYNKTIEINYVTINEFTKCHPECYQKLYYNRIYNKVFDNSKIEKFLPRESFTHPETGLEYCFIDFLNRKLSGMHFLF